MFAIDFKIGPDIHLTNAFVTQGVRCTIEPISQWVSPRALRHHGDYRSIIGTSNHIINRMEETRRELLTC